MGAVFYRENELVTVISKQAVTLEDIKQTSEQIRAGFSAQSTIRILVVDEGTEINPSQHEVKDLVSFWVNLYRDVNVVMAIVTTKDAHYGIARMISVLGESRGLPCQVFRDRSEAIQWIQAVAVKKRH